jgi:RNA polymerase sigma-70 factor (ECF subfamily)
MDATTLAQKLADLHHDSWGWCLACCRGDSHLAEDTLQQAYAKAVHGKLNFGGGSTLKTWWFGVLRFTALEIQRKTSRERAFTEKVRAEWQHWFGGRDEPDATSAPPPFEKILTQLATRQREVLELVFYQGMTIEEASRIMGVGLGSARTHYARGKHRLRQILEQTPSLTDADYEPTP